MVELLVVISVIGILAALLFPTLTGAKKKATAIQCVSNLREWGVAWTLYTSESGDSFTTGPGDRPRAEWLRTLRNAYGKKPNLLFCPVAKMQRLQDGKTSKLEVPVPLYDTNAAKYGGPQTAYSSGIEDPATRGKMIIASYGMNSWLANPPADVKKVQRRKTENDWRRMSDVTRPSEVPVMADAMWRGGGPKTTGLPGERPEFNGQWSGTQYDFKHFAMHRHNKGIQLVFVDGSARYVQVRDLWTLSWHRNFEVDYAKSRGKNFFPEWMR